MDQQHIRDHLQILDSRVTSLERELNRAYTVGIDADLRTKTLRDAVDKLAAERTAKAQEMASRLEFEKNDWERQIKLAEEVLERKKEERQALMGYLKSLDFDERSFSEFTNFDWDSLQKLAENVHKPSEALLEQHCKAEALNEAVQKAKHRITDLYEALASTSSYQDRLKKTLDEVKKAHKELNKLRLLQEKRIEKVQSDNERLNVLIKQCIATNEPMSDYISKNIKAKCHSFINSENHQELLDGLMKFKSRQDRIISLLRHKDIKLGNETTRLQVAKDQTHDQVRFYVTMLATRRNT